MKKLICNRCGKNLRQVFKTGYVGQLCKTCKQEDMKKFYKKYTKLVKQRMKEYNKKPEVKQRMKERMKEYTNKPEVKQRVIEYAKKYAKKTNYKYEKTPSARILRNIKRKTRYHFSLIDKKCELCGSPANEHHHININGNIFYDRFIYICKKCHKCIHKLNKQEVKQK